MRISQFFVSTLKEAPAEAELISHQLMLRAGFIRRLGSEASNWQRQQDKQKQMMKTHINPAFND